MKWKTAVLALALTLLFVGCNKSQKAEEQTAKTTNDTTNTVESLVNNVQLTDKMIDDLLDKAPKWMETAQKYQTQLQEMQKAGKLNGLGFVKEIPGFEKDLKTAGIDATVFLPQWEKFLRAYSFVRTLDNYNQQKAQVDNQRTQLQNMLNDKATPDSQKVQLRTALANFDAQIKQIHEFPPNVTAQDTVLIRKHIGDIDYVLSTGNPLSTKPAETEAPVPPGASQTKEKSK